MFKTKSNRPVKTMVASTATTSNFSSSSSTNQEIVPWGVQAVWQGSDLLQRGNFASDTYAFVIDSGVLNTTGDLNFASNPNWHKSWIAGQSPFVDGNGHGTHVAGVIGSLVNGKGIVGVAPGAQIVSLKVNNDQGFGDGSTTAEAIDYAANIINSNNLDKKKCVINLSISSLSRDPKLESSILRAADQGIQFAIAAGNSGKDVDNFAPACIGNHPNVYVTSAVDSSRKMPFWSNYDSLDGATDVKDIDFAAPGVNILSYYKDGQLGALSGTSQAAPHVAGLLITGGVQSGNKVSPNSGNAADPFAITSTQNFNPNYGLLPAVLPNQPVVSQSTFKEETPVFDSTKINSIWGTEVNDTIRGSSGNDIITGAIPTGTSLQALGRGQVDKLTGGVGSDIFVLGDKRGVFYNDGDSRNLGMSDYALITDFQPGVDKVQVLKSAFSGPGYVAGKQSYVQEILGGDTYFYWDRWRNGSIDRRSQADELIAVFQGVSSVGFSDMIFV